MACIYCNREGKCTLWDKDHYEGQNFNNSEMGFDDDGLCAVEDDPNPFDNCVSFEPVDSSEYEDNA